MKKPTTTFTNFFGRMTPQTKKLFMALCAAERRTQAQQLEVIIESYAEMHPPKKTPAE